MLSGEADFPQTYLMYVWTRVVTARGSFSIKGAEISNNARKSWAFPPPLLKPAALSNPVHNAAPTRRLGDKIYMYL